MRRAALHVEMHLGFRGNFVENFHGKTVMMPVVSVLRDEQISDSILP